MGDGSNDLGYATRYFLVPQQSIGKTRYVHSGSWARHNTKVVFQITQQTTKYEVVLENHLEFCADNSFCLSFAA